MRKKARSSINCKFLGFDDLRAKIHGLGIEIWNGCECLELLVLFIRPRGSVLPSLILLRAMSAKLPKKDGKVCQSFIYKCEEVIFRNFQPLNCVMNRSQLHLILMNQETVKGMNNSHLSASLS